MYYRLECVNIHQLLILTSHVVGNQWIQLWFHVYRNMSADIPEYSELRYQPKIVGRLFAVFERLTSARFFKISREIMLFLIHNIHGLIWPMHLQRTSPSSPGNFGDLKTLLFFYQYLRNLICNTRIFLVCVPLRFVSVRCVLFRTFVSFRFTTMAVAVAATATFDRVMIIVWTTCLAYLISETKLKCSRYLLHSLFHGSHLRMCSCKKRHHLDMFRHFDMGLIDIRRLLYKYGRCKL